MSSPLEQVVAELNERRGPLPGAGAVPVSTGIYVVWLDRRGWLDIQEQRIDIPMGEKGALYVGVGVGQRGLRGRFRQEWRPRDSGRSSPRRTLGALLAKELDLEPQPRPDRDPGRGARYYVFGDEGEQRLTDWLEAHAAFAWLSRDEIERLIDLDPLALETGLILHLRPPLNLAKAKRDPLRRSLEGLRKEMREFAAQAQADERRP